MNRPKLTREPIWTFTGRILLVITFTCYAPVLACGAQPQSSHITRNTRVLGKQDSELPLPPTSVVAGRKDSIALALLGQCVSRMSLTSVNEIQGTGTFTDQFASNPATLTYDNQGSLRLDVSTTKGQISVRMHDGYGAIRGVTGNTHTLTPETASGEWLPSPLLLLLKYNDAQTTVIDQGIVNTDIGALHRVTLEFPALTPSSPAQTTTVVDVYLNPSTGLVTKTASSIRLDTRDRASYFQVVTFGSYKSQDGSLLPFSYAVTLNGQPQWTLQLDSISLNPSLTASYFSF